MIKVVDSNEVVTRGNNIEEVVREMNSGAENGNEWYFVYRPDAGVVDGYLDASEEEADADLDGEKADVIYDVVEEEGEKPMERADYIEGKPYGVTECGGDTYILLEDAYGDWPVGRRPYYQALAVRDGEQPDEDDELPVYRIFWDVEDEYVDWDVNGYELKKDAPEDESVLCDWETASDIAYEGVMDAEGWVH